MLLLFLCIFHILCVLIVMFSLICCTFLHKNFTNSLYLSPENPNHCLLYCGKLLCVAAVIYLYAADLYFGGCSHKHRQHRNKHPNHRHHYPNPRRRLSYLNASIYDPQSSTYSPNLQLPLGRGRQKHLV